MWTFIWSFPSNPRYVCNWFLFCRTDKYKVTCILSIFTILAKGLLITAIYKLLPKSMQCSMKTDFAHNKTNHGDRNMTRKMMINWLKAVKRLFAWGTSHFCLQYCYQGFCHWCNSGLTFENSKSSKLMYLSKTGATTAVLFHGTMRENGDSTYENSLDEVVRDSKGLNKTYVV